MIKQVKKIYNEADEAMTLESFKRLFDNQNCIAIQIAEKTIAARKFLDGYGYYTCQKDDKKLFIGE
jgi:hypothetical protein